jgi:hypothetical protein
MDHYYLWRVVEHDNIAGTIESLVICYNSCVLSSENIYEDIEKALKSKDSLPDCVYIIGDMKQCNAYKDAWQNNNNLLSNMIRRGKKFDVDFVRQYIFLAWTGTTLKENVLTNSDNIYKFTSRKLLSVGVYSLLEKNNAIHQAPSGHVFKHPSGNKNNLFIQAREIATDEAELFVVSYLIASEYGSKLSLANKIYIDTMGIYAYVKMALTMCNVKPEIQSFHSYKELERIHPPSESYFCLISASTSGRMASFMCENKFEEKNIATLIDIKSKGRKGGVMVPLDEMGRTFHDLNKRDGTQIEIIGENFSSKAKPPRPVVIGLPHTPKELEEFHKYFGFSIPKFNEKIEEKSRLLHILADRILEDDDFKAWLNDEISWSFPIDVSHIIYAADDVSKSLAVLILSILEKKLANGDSISLISYSNLEAMMPDSTATGIVVVSAVSRDGGILREISRDLRSCIKAGIPRHFITPIGIPQTSTSWIQLKSFLTKNPSPRSYGFSNWIKMAIGDSNIQNTWECLLTLATEADGQPIRDIYIDGTTVNKEIISASIEKIVEEIDNSYHRFLHSPRGEALKLSEGFLFFAEDSEIAKKYEEVEQSALFLTISAVMQYAREHEDHTKSLCSNGYESVVLGPECFLRFNDAALQACILRASLSSELDYSASPQLSKLMREFLLKVFIRTEREFGDAALEFAASIAIGSLRLSRSDMDVLFKAVFKNLTEPSALIGLLTICYQKHSSY